MYYCRWCNKGFPHFKAYLQHRTSSLKHHFCIDCNEDFKTKEELKDHYINSVNHLYCPDCDEHFLDATDLLDHEEDNHCLYGGCKMMFESESDLHMHNAEHHYWCPSCNRFFQNQNNLNNHFNSSLHKPAEVICPARKCGRAFTCISALLLHFESGTCRSGLTLPKLNKIVVQADINNVITNSYRLLAGADGQIRPHLSLKQWATHLSFNGHAYECFLCHKEFHQLYALNAHLQSPKHQERIYRCPKDSCQFESSTLSALCQHVENGRRGVRRFKPVQDMLDSIIDTAKSLRITA